MGFWRNQDRSHYQGDKGEKRLALCLTAITYFKIVGNNAADVHLVLEDFDDTENQIYFPAVSRSGFKSGSSSVLKLRTDTD